MRVLVAALVAVLSITASVLLAASPSPGEAVSRVSGPDLRRTYPVSLDGLNVAARAEVDRRTFLVAALESLKARNEAEALARERVRQAAVSVRPPSYPQGSVNWDGIARCETGGNWSMTGPRFSGGLGFYNGTWDGFGGREFAPNAGLATREQQITVAWRVYARYGLSGWGCRAYG